MKPCMVLLFVMPLSAQVAPSSGGVIEWDRAFGEGRQHYGRGELAQAEIRFNSALAVARRYSLNDSYIGASLSSIGMVLLEQGRLSEAERVTSAAVAAYRKCPLERCWTGLGSALRNLALLYAQQNRAFDAERLLTEALSSYDRFGAKDNEIGLADLLESLGWIEVDRGRVSSAERHFRRGLRLVEAVPDAGQIRLRLSVGLSGALLGLNRKREAMEAARAAFTEASSRHERNVPDMVAAACALASAGARLGDYDLAETTLKSAQEMLWQIPEPEPRELSVVLTEFGQLRFLQKRFGEAAQFDSDALAIVSRHLSPDHPQVLILKTNYAAALRRVKRTREAKKLERELRATLQTIAPDPGAKHKINVADLKRKQ
jgi:tetratricopeptide (TPR) repeat protein